MASGHAKCRDLTLQTFRYLIRFPTRENPKDIPPLSPIVFLHGLGFGVAQYLPSILLFLELAPSDQPILVPLQPNISHAILHPFHMTPIPKAQWIASMKGLFHQLGWDRVGVTMISHSKGTVGHAWMLKAHPELIKRNCFMDPGMHSTPRYFKPCSQLASLVQFVSAYGKATCAGILSTGNRSMYVLRIMTRHTAYDLSRLFN